MFEDRPPAKVNLALEVLGRRSDGFHELRSVFLRVGLCDRLKMVPGGADGSDRLTLAGAGQGSAQEVPARDNLVTRAVAAVRARAQIPLPALDIELEKRIPVAAGLGGGSSDCASAIRLAQAAWGVRFSDAEEIALGASLGSDVPFFLSGPALALVEGRGERVTTLPVFVSAGLLLVTPAVPLSTARVFHRHDELGAPSAPAIVPPSDLSDLASVADRLRDANALWPAAASLAPSLAPLRYELESRTGRAWLMSGSGPTLFALYPSVTEAAADGRALLASRPATVAGAAMNAVDLAGPDPAWRYP